MARHWSKSALLAALLLAPVSANAADANYETLLKQYIMQNREALKANPKFLLSYAQNYSCAAWSTISSSNAMARSEALAALNKETVLTLEAVTVDTPKSSNLVIEIPFGVYNTDVNRFPLKLSKANETTASFEIKHDEKAQFDLKGYRSTCLPESPDYPLSFSLQLTNANVVDGIPFDRDRVEEFLSMYPDSRVHLGLSLTLDEIPLAVKNQRVEIKATLTQVDVISPTNTVLFSLKGAHFEENLKNQAAKRQSAAAAAAQSPLILSYDNPRNFDAWAKHLSEKGPDTLGDGSKLRSVVAKSNQQLTSGNITGTGDRTNNANNLYLSGWNKRDGDDNSQPLNEGRRVILDNASALNKALPISAADYERIKPLNGSRTYRGVAHIIGMPVSYSLVPPAYRDLHVKITEVWIMPQFGPNAVAAERAPIIIKVD